MGVISADVAALRDRIQAAIPSARAAPAPTRSRAEIRHGTVLVRVVGGTPADSFGMVVLEAASESANSRALAGRSAGSLANARAIAASTYTGTLGRTVRTLE